MNSILDKHRATESRQEVGKNLKENETLHNILTSQDKSSLFATYLSSEDPNGGPEIAERIKSGTLTESDLEDLTKKREDFVDRSKSIEHVKNYVNENTLSSYLAHSPELQKVVMLAGPGGTMKALNHHLELMAMTDKAKFDEIKSKVDILDEYRNGSYSKVEENFKNNVSKHGLNADRVSDILMSNMDDVKKRQSLKSELKNNLPFIKRVFQMKGRLNELMNESGNLAQSIEEYNKLAGEIGVTLNNTVRGNELVRKTFSEILVGDKPETLEKGMSFKNAREYLSSEKTMEDEWESYCLENKITSSSSQTDLDKAVQDFRIAIKNKNQEKFDNNKQKKNGGWFSLLFNLFNKKVDEFKPAKPAKTTKK
jgi:hypothetical protein